MTAESFLTLGIQEIKPKAQSYHMLGMNYYWYVTLLPQS